MFKAILRDGFVFRSTLKSRGWVLLRFAIRCVPLLLWNTLLFIPHF